MKNYFFVILFVFPLVITAQKTTLLRGFIKNKDKTPIEGVTVFIDKSNGTTTDERGFYQIRIPLNNPTLVTFQFLGYQTLTKTFTATNRSAIRFSPTLLAKSEVLNTVIIKNDKNALEGNLKIDPKKVKRIPGANAGVENLLMTLPGVNNNNELSTQYNVRGGNFDENLVYVNGIEVYRPFLVRSGQQEGLSFVNTNMVQNIKFSAGGFQAKYGDKLSSVLDIMYKKPKQTHLEIEGSLLGSSITYGDVFLNKKLNVITGIRYRDNSLFVNSKQVETNFRPSFTDVQTYINYEFNEKWDVSFLGNFSLNDYKYKPISRRTRFGTLANPIELIVFYNGQEKYQYLTTFGALSTNFSPNKNWRLNFTSSVFNTQEEEYFDIAASYNLGAIDNNIGSETFGEVEFSENIGSQLNHSRNDLDALITNIQFKGTYKNNKAQVDFGIKYQTENIKDRIREWEMINSSGFSIPNPTDFNTMINDQPYIPYEGPIIPFQSIRALNEVSINRLSGYVQYGAKTFWGDHEIWFNLGIRSQFWTIDNHLGGKSDGIIVSPRFQIAIKPDWEKDMVFRLSGGSYAQPPFYRELRGFDGLVNTSVNAQKSIHFVLGSDYSFIMWNRPFKLTAETYYKSLTDVNPYSVDNVRIRYQANNNAVAYATGVDIRLNGEFIPGNESWVSLGYLKTEENIDNQGYISRPTDQRLKFAVLFQDYVPNLPDLKAYLNLVYSTGVPGGAPAYANPYNFQNRLRDYKRADLGISYVIADANKQYENGWLKDVKEFTAGIELFNIFDVQNSITNTWVRDSFSRRQYGIPNFMTSRVLNFRFSISF